MINQTNNQIIQNIKSAALFLGGLTSASDADDRDRWFALNSLVIASHGVELGGSFAVADWQKACEAANQVAVKCIECGGTEADWAIDLLQDRVAHVTDAAGFCIQ